MFIHQLYNYISASTSADLSGVSCRDIQDIAREIRPQGKEFVRFPHLENDDLEVSLTFTYDDSIGYHVSSEETAK